MVAGSFFRATYYPQGQVSMCPEGFSWRVLSHVMTVDMERAAVLPRQRAGDTNFGFRQISYRRLLCFG